MIVQGLTDHQAECGLKPDLSDTKTLSTERCGFPGGKFYLVSSQYLPRTGRAILTRL